MVFLGEGNNFELKGYELLLNWLTEKADIFVFVTRSDIGINHHKKKLLEPYLVFEYDEKL